jgi:hypothetical protein
MMDNLLRAYTVAGQMVPVGRPAGGTPVGASVRVEALVPAMGRVTKREKPI